MTQRSQMESAISQYDGESARDQLDVVRSMYAEVYAEPPYSEGPQDVADFVEDWPRRIGQPGFRLVLAHVGTAPAGFAFGHQLKADTKWWDGALESLPHGITEEYPGRTFAVIELAIRKPFRRHRIASALHSQLLSERNEERVTLLVRPDARAAQQFYAANHYDKVGRIQPYLGSPVYDSMMGLRTVITTPSTSGKVTSRDPV